jgi:competence protein ComEA
MTMIRTFLPILALSVLVGVTAPAAAAAQSKVVAKAPAQPATLPAVNINTASVSELSNLPGIGAKTAARIVEYRQKNGPFKKAEDLMNVRGIGEKNFLKLKPQITVTPASSEQGHQAGH